jgi:hypothetical protein
VLPAPAAGRRHAVARHRGRPLPGPPAGLPVRVITADLTITRPAASPAPNARNRLTSTAKRRAARAPLTGTVTYKITIITPARANDLPGP